MADFSYKNLILESLLRGGLSLRGGKEVAQFINLRGYFCTFFLNGKLVSSELRKYARLTT
jgi:hypothetical protein